MFRCITKPIENVIKVIKECYNYFQYFSSLYYFLKYKDTKYSNKYLAYLDKSIYNCGPIGVKLIQLLIMYDGVLPISYINKLKYTLENCKVHSWKNTEDLYYANFGTHIYDDYNLINTTDDYNKCIVGSGSIGQVYKLYSKELQKYVAVKVKHPSVDYEIKRFVSTATFIMKYFSYITVIPYRNIINIFIDNINIQNDFIREACNTRKLRDNFKDDTHIIIPEVYDVNNNFIIMSYHAGTDINSISNKSLKYSIYNDMNFLTLSSIMVHDFMHADLHDGNWKIQVHEDNTYNIIIYDCGLVVSTNNLQFNQEVLITFLTGNFKNFVTILMNSSSMTNIDNSNLHKLETHVDKICSDSSLDSGDRACNIIKYAIDNNIINSSEHINLLLSYIMTLTIGKINALRIQKVINIPSNDVDVGVIFNLYNGLLDKMKKYTKLHDFFSAYINTHKDIHELYNIWLHDKFGHNDSSIIIDIIYNYIQMIM